MRPREGAGPPTGLPGKLRPERFRDTRTKLRRTTSPSGLSGPIGENAGLDRGKGKAEVLDLDSGGWTSSSRSKGGTGRPASREARSLRSSCLKESAQAAQPRRDSRRRRDSSEPQLGQATRRLLALSPSMAPMSPSRRISRPAGPAAMPRARAQASQSARSSPWSSPWLSERLRKTAAAFAPQSAHITIRTIVEELEKV